MSKNLVAYEIVNRGNPDDFETIDLHGGGDACGHVFSGMSTNLDHENWYIRKQYSDGTSDDDDD